MSRPSTVISVDLDGVACYHAIHGLPPPSAAERDVILSRCLPRYLELFAELGVRATFFVIGSQVEEALLAHGTAARSLTEALADGHELGNHSHAHAYDLVTWAAPQQKADLEACDRLLRELGAEPRGFRAPGYTHDTALLEQVVALGYRYDSSALPSPPYYAAKLAAMGMIALAGRKSQSMARGAATFSGERLPYRRDDVPLWELPMSVTPVARVPLIGTSLLSSPGWVSRRLQRAAERLDHFHLELHGIDLADPDVDGYHPDLVRRQPELKVPLSVKRERLATLLRQRGRCVTLSTLVEDLEVG